MRSSSLPETFSPNEYLGNLGFRDPRVFDSKWTSRTNFIVQRSVLEIERFSIERLSVITALEREVLTGFTTGFEAQFEQHNVFDVAPDAILTGQDVGFLRIATVGPFFVLDRRDDRFAPRQGFFDSFRLRYGSPLLASDIHFLKAEAQHTQYIPVLDSLGFVYALRGGWARSLRAHEEIPISERFFLGGRTTVRGFDENSIGPLGEDGSPQGGDFELNANTELRFPLWFGLNGALFVDGGGVYLQKEAISIHEFRRSTGLACDPSIARSMAASVRARSSLPLTSTTSPIARVWSLTNPCRRKISVPVTNWRNASICAAVDSNPACARRNTESAELAVTCGTLRRTRSRRSIHSIAAGDNGSSASTRRSANSPAPNMRWKSRVAM